MHCGVIYTFNKIFRYHYNKSLCYEENDVKRGNKNWKSTYGIFLNVLKLPQLNTKIGSSLKFLFLFFEPVNSKRQIACLGLKSCTIIKYRKIGITLGLGFCDF